MAKKSNKKNKQPAEYAAENYYDLKTDAIERLVDTKAAPEVSEAEIRKYTGGKFHIPSWIKILFVKFWFSGAICYFFLWGLGMYLQNLDLMVALAIGLGLTTDLMVNYILHTFEPTEGEYNKWMMVTRRKFWSLFVNIIYAGLLLFCVMQAYNLINTVLVGDVETAEKVAVGVEPFLFGLLYMGFDMLFITMKNTFINVIRDAKKKASGK